ncbi:Boma109a [Bombyx mandarina nucleopolyhedrovirus]|uniref:ORF109A n=2 Tax=Bombyx mori nuclear polyhedrosis virus TaxID=271108 RepID=A0A8F4XBY4_NPVBM|nr:Boma109a [Bombyx mandarina nucleopolyhedrovirus]QXI73307.1 ORF109A [Bombyx mori nucleopolyhedrovirus]
MSVLDAVEWIANRVFECKDKFIINKLTNADALQHLKFLKVNYNKVVDEHVSTSQYLS